MRVFIFFTLIVALLGFVSCRPGGSCDGGGGGLDLVVSKEIYYSYILLFWDVGMFDKTLCYELKFNKVSCTFFR